MRRLAILGSTGSIGTQTLDVVRQHRDLFEVELLTANNNVELLASQAIEFDANAAVICNDALYNKLASLLENTTVKAFAGMDSVCSLVGAEDVDMVVGAMVGFSGLRPAIAAIKADKILALANKETLVAAGSIVEKLGAKILPVDSEHSAIFQCLQGSDGNRLSKIHLTASGGPFRTWSKSQIASAKASDALKHPNWNMGAKVTIDSATMMNKGLEVIEAKWLFGLEPKDINVLVHPESIVHSMVEFEDGAVLAQLGVPDMRLPIQYALSYPNRLPLQGQRLDFSKSLTFEKPDFERFPCLKLAFDAIEKGGTAPCAMNAANEVAVAAFLKDEIGFYDIPLLVQKTIDSVEFTASPSLDDIFAVNDLARQRAQTFLH